MYVNLCDSLCKYMLNLNLSPCLPNLCEYLCILSKYMQMYVKSCLNAHVKPNMWYCSFSSFSVHLCLFWLNSYSLQDWKKGVKAKSLWRSLWENASTNMPLCMSSLSRTWGTQNSKSSEIVSRKATGLPLYIPLIFLFSPCMLLFFHQTSNFRRTQILNYNVIL